MNFPSGFSSILVIIYRFGEKGDGKDTDGGEPTPKFPVRDIRIAKVCGMEYFVLGSGGLCYAGESMKLRKKSRKKRNIDREGFDRENQGDDARFSVLFPSVRPAPFACS